MDIESSMVKVLEELSRIDESLNGNHGLHQKIDELNGRIYRNTEDINKLKAFKNKLIGVTKVTLLIGVVSTLIIIFDRLI